MCGVTGFLSPKAAAAHDEMIGLAERMNGAMVHRGPDSAGAWADEAAGIALAQRRLSVIDLSDAGRQPMVSACGRYVLVYNGEIYNAGEMADELLPGGFPFRGRSDTEVLLEAAAHQGVDRALKAAIGMFAFALWDRKARTLTLARDRLGIKPLYWAETAAGDVLFGSELKPLMRHPGYDRTLNREALAAYLRFAYVPAPHAIHGKTRKVRPGTYVTISAGAAPRETVFWDLETVAAAGRADPFQGSGRQAVEELDRLLRDAVSRRMAADVPLGAFLSGGVDSSTVAALMQAQSARPIRTFSIGFNDAGFNEARHAKAVARHLGTDHTELYVGPSEASDVIPNLAAIYDEPFADSSQIPAFLVSRLARREVTVSLSGDGGDELFAGYNRYQLADRLWRRVSMIPKPVRRLAARAIKVLPPDKWTALSTLVPSGLRAPQMGDKAHKLADILPLDQQGVYDHLVSLWPAPEALTPGLDGRIGPMAERDATAGGGDFIAAMQFMDTLAYLPDDILTKVDRASMAVSLEARVPLIDHRVVAFSWRLPQAMKIKNGVTKWALREVLYRYVPSSLIERPKMGFGAPIGEWLRGPLRDWAQDLLDETKLREDGLFDARPIRQAWREHLSGTRNWQYRLWTILMFQAWRRAYSSGDSRA